MSIEVRVNTSVSPLWTCIKLATKHIVCRRIERHYFEFNFCLALCVSVSLLITPTLCIPLILCVLCCCPTELVVSVSDSTHVHHMVSKREGYNIL